MVHYVIDDFAGDGRVVAAVIVLTDDVVKAFGEVDSLHLIDLLEVVDDLAKEFLDKLELGILVRNPLQTLQVLLGQDVYLKGIFYADFGNLFHLLREESVLNHLGYFEIHLGSIRGLSLCELEYHAPDGTEELDVVVFFLCYLLRAAAELVCIGHLLGMNHEEGLAFFGLDYEVGGTIEAVQLLQRGAGNELAVVKSVEEAAQDVQLVTENAQ